MKLSLPGWAPRSSLRWRLSLSISGVALLCTALCFAAAVLFLRQALTDRATVDLRRSLDGVSGYLENQRSDLLGTARLVASDPVVQSAALRQDHRALIVHLTPFYADLNVDVLDVVDQEGRMLVRMENTLASGDTVSAGPGVYDAFQGHQMVGLSSDVPGRQDAGGYALRAMLPMRHGSRVVGVVIVGRQLDSIFAARIGHALNAGVNLIAGGQRTGTTLTDRYGLPATGLNEPADVLRRVDSGRTTISTVTEGGHAALSGIVPLQGTDGRWIGAVELIRPLDPLYEVIRFLSFLLLALGGVVVALGVLFALDISRRLTSRLLVLDATASRIAAMASTDTPLRQLHVGIPVRGTDEVASLGRSFSAMMRALDERIEANAQLYSSAQARVRELSGLAEIARLLTATPSVRETVELLGEHVCRLVGCSAVAIWLPGEGPLPSLYGGHGLPESYEALSNDLLVRMMGTPFETAAQTALRTGQFSSRRLADEVPCDHAGSVPPLYDSMTSRNWKRATAVPLRVQNRVVGALTCYSTSAGEVSDSDLNLLTTIADQVAVGVENARLYVRSRDTAALEERQRLARELHDSVSQALYGVALGARTARTVVEQDPAAAIGPLDYVLTLAEAGLTEMRSLIFELRPEALNTEGLIVALEKQIEALRVRHGLPVDAVLGAEPDIPFAAKEALYRIAQEALHNTVKHARAQRASICLSVRDHRVFMEIGDDGTGFDPGGAFPGHLGLQSMRERATRLGGTLQIESTRSLGTWVRVKIPIVPTGAAASSPPGAAAG